MPSSVVLTGFQVLSRVFLTWAVTHSVREVRLFSFLSLISSLSVHQCQSMTFIYKVLFTSAVVFVPKKELCGDTKVCEPEIVNMLETNMVNNTDMLVSSETFKLSICL